MTRTVTIAEASEQIDQLLVNVISGEEEIIIERDGNPVARLISVAALPKQRSPGCDKGKFVVTAAFFEPLPDESNGGPSCLTIKN